MLNFSKYTILVTSVFSKKAKERKGAFQLNLLKQISLSLSLSRARALSPYCTFFTLNLFSLSICLFKIEWFHFFQCLRCQLQEYGNEKKFGFVSHSSWSLLLKFTVLVYFSAPPTHTSKNFSPARTHVSNLSHVKFRTG